VPEVGERSLSGLMNDTISMPRYSTAEIDVVGDNPGSTFSTSITRTTWRTFSPGSTNA
jgi:hypothetical protein